MNKTTEILHEFFSFFCVQKPTKTEQLLDEFITHIQGDLYSAQDNLTTLAELYADDEDEEMTEECLPQQLVVSAQQSLDSLLQQLETVFDKDW